MKKIILTIFCFGMLFPLLGSAARPYGVEEIPNVQVGNRYRFTSVSYTHLTLPTNSRV